jgi:hypothetical protein
MQARDPILVVAERVVPSIFDPILEAAGFSPALERQHEQGSKQWLYRGAWERSTGGQRPHDVDLTLSVEPRDVPWFLGITLGDGPNRLGRRLASVATS